MSVNLKVSLGTVNYTDYLHVTAAKVGSPSIIVWETWIDVPVTNYNFIIPGLDPENYIVSYYDAATNTSLGTLVMQLIVNALTGDTISERRFYTCGGAGTYDPADGATSLTDPYLINKNVTGVFKEGLRYYEPDVEYSFDDTIGKMTLINGIPWDTNEKVIVEIKYLIAAQTSGSGNGLYNGVVTVTEATRTLLISELDARIRCMGTAATQVITLPSLNSFAVDKGFYFDNSVDGRAVQVKLLFPGTDKLRFNGFMTDNNLFSEFWVSKGEHLLIRKSEDNYWEVINDYAGVHVGEKVTLGYNAHPNTLVEMAGWFDGDEYGRVWWWLNYVLPATHKYTATETDPIDVSRMGQFAIHPTAKKFRMPFTIYMTERGLHNFTTPGAGDITRSVPYPGGWQDESVGQISFSIKKGDGYTGHVVNAGIMAPGQHQSPQPDDIIIINKDKENIAKNIGVVYARRI